MFRYFRALWYFCTGRFSAAAETLASNEFVMAATYDASIEKSQKRYHTVRNAVAKLVSIEQEKVTKVQALTEKFQKLEKVKQGAAGKAKALAEQLKGQGQTNDQIKKNADYLKHMAAFQNAATSATDTENDIQGLEKELDGHRAQIAQYKIQLQNMQRSNKDLQEEKQEAIADVAIAKEMQAVNDVLNGLTEDTVDKDLIAARKARQNAKAKAHITAELAGNDAQLAEAEYVDFAANNDASSEFDALIGLTEDDTDSNLDAAKLPE
jgi:predicted  nucleic acid-binding Zn-ribbon protein